jgi:uncharacterized protein (TIGR03435 family)
MRVAAGISILAVMAGVMFAQNDASAPSFDAASVKVSAPLPSGVIMFSLGGLRDSLDPGRIDYKGVTIKQLVARAYGLKDYQVEGPQWVDSERYDVIATIPQGSTKEQVNLMLQRLLAERFKLTLHHESKPQASYTLSIGKGGAKMQEVDPDKLPPLPPPGSAPLPPPPPPGPGGSMSKGPMPAGAMRIQVSPSGRHLVGNGTIGRLCTMISNLTDRPVNDLTELKGTYAFDLEWAPDDNERMGKVQAGMQASMPSPAASGQPGPESAGDPLPTLTQALQTNYGLKLEARKAPADFIVIDHAEKTPTEN